MSREKIISLASDAGFDIDEANEYHELDEIVDSANLWITSRIERFYLAAQREAFEAAAKLCDNNACDYTREGAEVCAAAIREMAKENGE